MSNYYLTLENDSMDGIWGCLNTLSSNPLNSNQYLQIKSNINYLGEMEANNAL